MTRFLCIGLLYLLLAGATATPAAAQESDEEVGNVRIEFDVGEYDTENNDWPITVVVVSGDLEDGEEFTVELRSEDGGLVWSETTEFDGPTMRLVVEGFVAVGDVAEAGVAQVLPTEVAGAQVQPRAEVFRSGGGTGGGGQLALSMVMAVLLVAIVFRSPVPASSTQRWRK